MKKTIILISLFIMIFNTFLFAQNVLNFKKKEFYYPNIKRAYYYPPFYMSSLFSTDFAVYLIDYPNYFIRLYYSEKQETMLAEDAKKGIPLIEIEKSIHKNKIDDLIQIDNNLYLRLGCMYEGQTPGIQIIKGNNVKNIAIEKDQEFNSRDGYIYIDYLNKKIYLYASIYGRFSPSGIMVYDIEKDKGVWLLQNIVVLEDVKDRLPSDWNLLEYSEPMRIPNSPYLICQKIVDRSNEKKWQFLNGAENWQDDFKDGFYLCLIEIPEWRAEVELQKKNMEKNPNTSKVLIDGPAKIRDKPNGKVIATLGDFYKVIILEQQGDWYHILYAHIDGWTHKYNLRIEWERRF